MGQTPRTLHPNQSPLHFFGAEVRRLRTERGLSQAELGRRLFHHKDLIRKIEAAQRVPSRDFVERCDEVLGAEGLLWQMWPVLQRERLTRRAHGAAPVPYRSEAVDRPVLDWLVATTTDARRHRSNDHDATGRAAHTLNHLRAIDHLHGAGDSYAETVRYLDRDFDELVARAPHVATGFLELAGYEAVDLGADGLAQQHYVRALDIITASGDRLYGGYLVAVSLAHLALHCGDVSQALRLATAAIRGCEDVATPAVRAAFRVVLARGYARLGEESACAAALVQVEADLSRSRPGDEPAWITYFGEADFADEKAHCFFHLGLYELACREAVRATALVDPARVRRLAIDTALHASALARGRDIEQACAIGRQAVDYAARTASFRSRHRVALMMAELQPHADLPPVRDLAEHVRTRLPFS
jgi:transcriptional regulator with XRE-family HTH domain